MRIAFDAMARLTSPSVMAPTPPWMIVQLHAVGAQLVEGVGNGLERALHVRLHDDAKLLLIGGLHPLDEARERDARVVADERLVALHLAAVGDLLGLLRVLDGVQRIAGAGDIGEAEDLDRRGRRRLVHLLAVLVRHRADLAEAGACEDEVADA